MKGDVVYKWGSITFGVGLALVIIDIVYASRKKEGITPGDKQRIKGLFWVTCVATARVAGLFWLAE